MKLILAILHDKAEGQVTKALTSAGFRVTAIASSGGFLKRGMTTLIIGVEDQKLNEALSVLRTACRNTEAEKSCGTLFVLNIEDSIHY